MKKRGAGISLLGIAAVLFIFRNSVHLLVAAIMGRKDGVIGEGMFDYALSVTKTYSVLPEIIALILGVIYLIWAEIKKE
ncbi:hypothetical protein AWM70_14805 [Paenibacillus yonginensis]|uniref:Uncharacterized protein n=2 Tax=Paenibacillus TaxID=44249 RepID=A0A1B1N2R5_9BACL|nr:MULTISPECIES: hypothetical protein [Paenibacillus]ANS75712.1 hypothetical protein AWM70_14805 [Paenibacillus yonginensis]GGA53480.1 hypothetical protein GCM10010917_43310 [Paenibacillus physcomitrellae]